MQNHTLSVAEAIRNRRTVRHYRPDAVPPAVLAELLALATEAPTSWNLQDRSIVAITTDEGREGLGWATGGQPQPQEAPVTLVFVAEPQSWRDDHQDVYDQARRSGAWNEQFIAMFAAASQSFQQDLEERGLLREYAVKDAVIAATYVMLAATEMGLATSPMNGWDEAKVKKVIGVEDRDDLAIALLVSVGYAAEERRHPGRRPVEHNIFHQRYGALRNAVSVAPGARRYPGHPGHEAQRLTEACDPAAASCTAYIFSTHDAVTVRLAER